MRLCTFISRLALDNTGSPACVLLLRSLGETSLQRSFLASFWQGSAVSVEGVLVGGQQDLKFNTALGLGTSALVEKSISSSESTSAQSPWFSL